MLGRNHEHVPLFASLQPEENTPGQRGYRAIVTLGQVDTEAARGRRPGPFARMAGASSDLTVVNLGPDPGGWKWVIPLRSAPATGHRRRLMMGKYIEKEIVSDAPGPGPAGPPDRSRPCPCHRSRSSTRAISGCERSAGHRGGRLLYVAFIVVKGMLKVWAGSPTRTTTWWRAAMCRGTCFFATTGATAIGGGDSIGAVGRTYELGHPDAAGLHRRVPALHLGPGGGTAIPEAKLYTAAGKIFVTGSASSRGVRRLCCRRRRHPSWPPRWPPSAPCWPR